MLLVTSIVQLLTGCIFWTRPAGTCLSAPNICSLKPLRAASHAPLLALLSPQQSNLSRHRTWSFAHSCQDACCGHTNSILNLNPCSAKSANRFCPSISVTGLLETKSYACLP